MCFWQMGAYTFVFHEESVNEPFAVTGLPIVDEISGSVQSGEFEIGFFVKMDRPVMDDGGKRDEPLLKTLPMRLGNDRMDRFVFYRYILQSEITYLAVQPQSGVFIQRKGFVSGSASSDPVKSTIVQQNTDDWFIHARSSLSEVSGFIQHMPSGKQTYGQV